MIDVRFGPMLPVRPEVFFAPHGNGLGPDQRDPGLFAKIHIAGKTGGDDLPIEK
jgi:hypothetical protein